MWVAAFLKALPHRPAPGTIHPADRGDELLFQTARSRNQPYLCMNSEPGRLLSVFG